MDDQCATQDTQMDPNVPTIAPPKRIRFNKPSVLREDHKEDCTCSYCGDKKTGLVLPKCKRWNAWRSIRWYKDDRLQVVRWTLPRIYYG